MKIGPAQVDRFCANLPNEVKAVLLYGPDGGKVRAYAQRICKQIVEDLSDPFNLTDLAADEAQSDPARLHDEVRSQSLMGGRRVIRLRGAGERLAPVIEAALEGAGSDNLLVVEGGELRAGGALRKLFEAARKDIAIIACYADEARDVARLAGEMFQSAGVSVGQDVLRYLGERLGGDRFASTNEINKLILLAGEERTLSLETVLEAIGDSAAVQVDLVISAAADGIPDQIVRGLDRAFVEGDSPIGILRQAQSYFQKLHLARSIVSKGGSPADAVGALRPKVFFKAVQPMTRQVARWSEDGLGKALHRLGEAEIKCKTAGYPDIAECGAAFIDVARLALTEQRRR